MATGRRCFDGRRQVLLHTAEWEDLKGLMDDVGRHLRRDLPGLLVSNEGNFRNRQVERDQPQGHYDPDVASRSSEGFQANEGR